MEEAQALFAVVFIESSVFPLKDVHLSSSLLVLLLSVYAGIALCKLTG